MSMILDALKRSRGDSQRSGSVPTVDTEHFVATEPSRFPLPIMGALGALGIAALVTIGYLIFDDSAETKPESAQATIQTTPSIQTTPPIQARPSPASTSPAAKSAQVSLSSTSTTAQPRRPQNASVTSEVAALYSDVSETGVAGGESQQSGVDPDAIGRLTSTDSTADVGTSEAAATEGVSSAASGAISAPEDTPIDIADVLLRAEEALGQERLTPHPTPVLSSMSQQQKNQIPSVLYSVHNWNPSGESTVVLNGKSLSLGQRHNGFLVKEILSDSVILSWGGKDFRLPALNSWVNL